MYTYYELFSEINLYIYQVIINFITEEKRHKYSCKFKISKYNVGQM